MSYRARVVGLVALIAICSILLWLFADFRGNPPMPETSALSSVPTPLPPKKSSQVSATPAPSSVVPLPAEPGLVRVTADTPPPAPSPNAALVAPPGPPLLDTEEVARDFEAIQLMFRDFRTVAGENPVGTNAEIMAAVMGGNSKQARLGPPEGQHLNSDGELLDHWGTPYFFHQLSADQMEIRSAGADRKLYTTDDLVVR